MKIGILVNESKSIFTNGCLQQGYFLLKSFRSIENIECNFVSATENFTKFEVVEEDIHVLKSDKDLDRYDLLVFSSGSINNNSYMSYCKLKNIKMVNLCVGNYYIINQEEFVFDLHKSNDVMSRMYNKFLDHVWLMPMYSHNINYMKYITKKSLSICPYVWDSTFIDKYRIQNNLNMNYTPTKQLLDIVILEPNVSIHKTSLVPLLICEEFYNKNPNKLGKIYLFCEPDSNFKENLWYLKIFRDDKVEFFNRMVSMDLYSSLNNLGKKYVILSSNIRNGLNFLHLECFKLNIPIIHNCKPFKNSGLYYQEDDIYDDYPLAIEHLLSVYNNRYLQNTDDILNTYSPNNINNIEKYNSLANDLTNKKSIINTFIQNMNENSKTYNMNDKLAIVFTIEKIEELSNIDKNIKFIKKLGIKHVCYIVDNSDILKSRPNKFYNVVNINKDSYTLLEIYRTILHNNMVIIDGKCLIQFDISQIIDKGDIVGIQIEKEKELSTNDYDYNISILNMLETILPKQSEIKIFDSDMLFVRNSSNIINAIKNIDKSYNYDNITINNIIFQLFYRHKISLTNTKFLLYGDENNIVGKGYSNGDVVLYYKQNNQLYNSHSEKKIVFENKLFKYHQNSSHQY